MTAPRMPRRDLMKAAAAGGRGAMRMPRCSNTYRSRWLGGPRFLRGLLASVIAGALCSQHVRADYVPPPEERLFARSSAIVDATVTDVKEQKHFAIKVHEILWGNKPPSVLTNQLAGAKGELGWYVNRTRRYVLVLYGQDVRACFPVRPGARGKREVQYERTWIPLEAFRRRLPVDLKPHEKDPRKVLAAISVFGGEAMARAHASLKANKEFVRIAARISGDALLQASAAARKDPEIVLSATGDRSPAWPHAHEDLWSDASFVLRLRRAVPPSTCILRNADPKLRDNKDLVMQVVKVNGSELAFASERLRKDRRVVQAAGSRGLPHADLRWRDDKPFVLSILKRHGGWLGAASERLKADREVVLTAVRSSGSALSHASTKLRSDREIVLAAVTNNGHFLRVAAEPLRADRGVVLAAVQSHGEALRFAAPALRKDPEICLAAVRQKGSMIQVVGHRVPGYRKIALAAVRQDGRALRYVSVAVQKDREVALAAVSQSGGVLGTAPPEIRRDREIALAAARRQVYALADADGRLLVDPDFILAAARHNPYALAYALGPAASDPRIKAMREDRKLFERAPHALGGASDRLKSDPELILRAIASCGPGAIHCASQTLWDNERFVLRAIETSPWVLRHAPWRIRADPRYVLAAVTKDGLTFALADRTIRDNKAIAIAALKSNPRLLESFDRLARGGVQWDPDVRAAYAAARRLGRN